MKFVFGILLTGWLAMSLALASSQHGYIVRIGDGGNLVRVTDAQTRGTIREFHLPESWGTALSASIDGDELSIVCGDGKVRVYNISHGELLRTEEGSAGSNG